MQIEIKIDDSCREPKIIVITDKVDEQRIEVKTLPGAEYLRFIHEWWQCQGRLCPAQLRPEWYCGDPEVYYGISEMRCACVQ